MYNVQHIVTNHTESQISQEFSLHWWMTLHVFIQKMYYSLTSRQLYFLVPLSSFLAHLLAPSHNYNIYIYIYIYSVSFIYIYSISHLTFSFFLFFLFSFLNGHCKTHTDCVTLAKKFGTDFFFNGKMLEFI